MPAAWITNGTGATTPVYTNVLGSLFGGTSATTTSSNWYVAGLSNQTPTTSSAWISAADAANDAYVQWEDDVDHTQYIALAQQRVVATRIRTEEELARDLARWAEVQAEQTRRRAERTAALERSHELLLAHLTAKQRETFETNKWFMVEGGRSQQHYRINERGISGNIDVLEGVPGKVTHRLCCHLRDVSVPLYDHLLAQKVWIEHDEDAFLRQANRHAA